MGKRTKKQSQQRHFAASSLRRVGVRLNDQEIIKAIQNNELEFIDRQSNRITRWKYTFEDKDYMVVYDKTRKQVVTIIPYQTGMEDNILTQYYWWIQQV